MEVGSSTLPGTTSPRGGLAQLARAPALQAGGRRFESVILHDRAGMDPAKRPMTCCHKGRARAPGRESRGRARGRGFVPLPKKRAERGTRGGWRHRPRREQLKRARGGCLGSRRRRRAWQAAKSRGEAQAACDPRIPEWGNPCGMTPHIPPVAGGERGEPKHPSTRRRRRQQ